MFVRAIHTSATATARCRDRKPANQVRVFFLLHPLPELIRLLARVNLNSCGWRMGLVDGLVSKRPLVN